MMDRMMAHPEELAEDIVRSCEEHDGLCGRSYLIATIANTIRMERERLGETDRVSPGCFRAGMFGDTAVERLRSPTGSGETIP
jgi:hypothetical protein